MVTSMRLFRFESSWGCSLRHLKIGGYDSCGFYAGVGSDRVAVFAANDSDEAVPFSLAIEGVRVASCRITDGTHTDVESPVSSELPPHAFVLLSCADGRSEERRGQVRGVLCGCPRDARRQVLFRRNNRMTGKDVPELDAAAAAGDDFVVDYVRVYDLD